MPMARVRSGRRSLAFQSPGLTRQPIELRSNGLEREETAFAQVWVQSGSPTFMMGWYGGWIQHCSSGTLAGVSPNRKTLLIQRTERSSPLLRSRLGFPHGDGLAWTSPTSLKICQSVRDEMPLKILQSMPPGWQVVSFSEILQSVCDGRRDIIPLFRMLLGRDGRAS